MKICKCGFALIDFLGVIHKEYACFKCGNTEEFFNGCENVEPDERLQEAASLKKEFYDKVKFENDENGNCKGLSPSQFKQELEKLKDL